MCVCVCIIRQLHSYTVWSSQSLICRKSCASHPSRPGSPCVLRTAQVSWHWNASCMWICGKLRSHGAMWWRLFNQAVYVHVVMKTLRYRNPIVDTTAARNPIVIASHGWCTADMETPTATPPARMHDCICIWRRSEDIFISSLWFSGYLHASLSVCILPAANTSTSLFMTDRQPHTHTNIYCVP